MNEVEKQIHVSIIKTKTYQEATQIESFYTEFHSTFKMNANGWKDDNKKIVYELLESWVPDQPLQILFKELYEITNAQALLSIFLYCGYIYNDDDKLMYYRLQHVVEQIKQVGFNMEEEVFYNLMKLLYNAKYPPYLKLVR